MSKLSTYSNRISQQSFDHSLNVEDLIKQNQQLKQNMQMLLKQIEDMNKILEDVYNDKTSPHENYPNINQQELQALAHQVIQLQQQLDAEKLKSQNINQPNVETEETIQIITELSKEFQTMQDRYQKEVQTLQKQLETQKIRFKEVLENTQNKFSKNIQEHNILVEKLKKKDTRIAQLQKKLQESAPLSKKQLKISTTIQDLRITLEKQIQEKQKTIKKYEQLCKGLKGKLSEK